MFNLKHERISSQCLGTGNFANLYPYQKNPEDFKWVVKHIIAKNDLDLIRKFDEIVLGFSCDHDSIVPVRGYNIQKIENSPSYNVYIKLPRMKESLKQVIQRNKQNNTPFEEKDIIAYLYSLLCGFEYLHSKKIAHRDIKPDNILFDYQGKAKLSDIGLTKFVDDNETSYFDSERLGTRNYMAPELFKKKDWYKADAWSLGVIIAELCNLIDHKIQNPEERDKDFKNKLIQGEMNYNKDLVHLLRGLLELNPEKRMSIEEARKYMEKNLVKKKG